MNTKEATNFSVKDKKSDSLSFHNFAELTGLELWHHGKKLGE